MFNLSDTLFADFLLNPKKVDSKSPVLTKLRDYRDGGYWKLKEYRDGWDSYQCYLEDHRRTKKKKEEKKDLSSCSVVELMIGEVAIRIEKKLRCSIV